MENLDPPRSKPWRCEEEEEELDSTDHFDRLPDSLILEILNLVGDVKALGRCTASSRRFRSLVPLVDAVTVRVDCVISDDPSASAAAITTSIASIDRTRKLLSHLGRLLARPLHALGQILLSARPEPESEPEPEAEPEPTSRVSHHSPAEVLKSFRDVRRLRIVLPAGELGIKDGVLLKWKAGFGSTLDSCVILGATANSSEPVPNEESGGGIPESFYTNGSLKMRVVWTISSLIAASARHYLLHQIVADHETLESLELTDVDGQGMLTMDATQMRELRMEGPVSASGSSQRTRVPALSMKMWYASHLEIPGGAVLKGATLLAIRPTEEGEQKEGVREVGGDRGGGCWVSDAFEEPYRTAARMLVKRRTYCLEMNSF